MAYLTDTEFAKLIDTAPDNANIRKYLMVTRQKLSEFKRIFVSYSGGSDSDVMLDMFELVKPPDCGEIKYVFFNTGFEWDATLRHVTATADKYGVDIIQRHAELSIPTACKRHGIPFLSKIASEYLCKLQKINFNWAYNWEDAVADDMDSSGLKWFYDVYKSSNPKYSNTSIHSILKNRLLKEFICNTLPPFPISDKCCEYVKKKPSRVFEREYNPDLVVIGMRMSEGGRRIVAIKSCFHKAVDKGGPAHFYPLFYFSDLDKLQYKQWRNITYSDCYELWSFKRTGCVGCPISHRAEVDLEIAKPYEPNKAKAAYAIFGQSYEYRRQYNEFKKNYCVGGGCQIKLEI